MEGKEGEGKKKGKGKGNGKERAMYLNLKFDVKCCQKCAHTTGMEGPKKGRPLQRDATSCIPLLPSSVGTGQDPRSERRQGKERYGILGRYVEESQTGVAG